jgi:hypothetical protein
VIPSAPPVLLLHGGTTVGGWTAKQIHQAVLTTFDSQKSLGGRAPSSAIGAEA